MNNEATRTVHNTFPAPTVPFPQPTVAPWPPATSGFVTVGTGLGPRKPQLGDVVHFRVQTIRPWDHGWRAATVVEVAEPNTGIITVAVDLLPRDSTDMVGKRRTFENIHEGIAAGDWRWPPAVFPWVQ